MGGKNSITLNKKPLNKNNGILPLNKKPLNNIQQLFNFNKKPTVIRGGVLEDSDIEKINELITNQLAHFGLIPAIEPAAIEPAAINPAIDAAAIKVNIPDMVFAKSKLPLAYRNGFSSNVYFHMVKITKKNVTEWDAFTYNIKIITPNELQDTTGNMLITPPDAISKLDKVARNSRTIFINAGLDYFNIRESDASSDLFVVYASKRLNKTMLPPTWQDVEIMVTVISKEGVPFATPMGIVKLAHTYQKEAFGNMLGQPKSDNPSIIENRSISSVLYDELNKIKFNYPSHRRISLYLFTFIGTRINQFYLSEKTALFTSPTDTISSIVTNTLKHDYSLPYGYERNVGLRLAPNYIVKLNLYNLHDEFLILSRDNLKELCPWYCNIFGTVHTQVSFPGDKYYNTEDEYYNFEYTQPENTEDCYRGADDKSPFLYVPIYSFTQLVERGIYQFEAIE
jgi:hypothetical protein